MQVALAIKSCMLKNCDGTESPWRAVSVPFLSHALRGTKHADDAEFNVLRWSLVLIWLTFNTFFLIIDNKQITQLLQNFAKLRNSLLANKIHPIYTYIIIYCLT